MSNNNSKFKLAGRSVNPTYLIGVFILCACIIGLTWRFLQNYEQVTRTDYALKTQAQYNPYYAAELLINSIHATTTGSDEDEEAEFSDETATTLLDSDLKTLIGGLPDIDKEDLSEGRRPTLIINSIGTKLTDARFDALKSWIEQGGHLITFTSKNSNHNEMQAAIERLDTLQEAQASPETIRNDETLNELIEPLNSGNEFLNQLGIFRVNPDVNPDSDSNEASEFSKEEVSAQLDELLNEVQRTETKEQQALEQNKPSKEFIEDKLAELLEEQSLSLINLTAYNESNEDEASAAINQNLLLVKGTNYGSLLNSQLFQSFYPDSANINAQLPNTEDKTAKQKMTKQQAQLIRQYINENRINDSTSNKNSLASQKSNVNPKDSNTKNSSTKNSKNKGSENTDLSNRLPELLAAILALDDAQLVELLHPMDDVYLDTTFGNGRLSVINDNDVFSNPNPNIELSDVDSTDGKSSDAVASTHDSALYELLTPSYYYTSLLSADNSAWLIALTQDSSMVWILPNTDIDALPVMLWKQARPAVLGLGLLALLWLWSLYNRFGKMARLPSSEARDIMRYFRQIGRFGWHQDHAQQLTKATRHEVRLLVNEHLKSNMTHANVNLRANSTVVNSTAANSTQVQTADITQSHTLKLHALLSARLEDRKKLLARAVKTNDLDSDDGLLLTNEAFIRETIAPERLRNAFDSRLQSSSQAFEFTQMTQTLWMIQWLLT